ncbi:MAG: DNA/RNA non-specific endonuclease [Bacteroidales bacterium]|nr:DNA/RNA non-specific endonuclease [Candidatus Cryptobacteroides aphodequi]
MHSFSGIIRSAAAAFVLAAAFLVSCTPAQQGASLALDIPEPVVNNNKGSQFINISADGAWSMELDFGEDTLRWARVKYSEGEGPQANTLYWEVNRGSEPRTLTIILKAKSGSASATFTQNAKLMGQIVTLKSDPVSNWMELPEVNDPSRYFITHDMTIGTRTMRNYSLYLDPDAKISVWVAYPLNPTLSGGTNNRTDAWALDPKVPREYQPVLMHRSFSGYQRGHQLPSRDRCVDEDCNEATFYGTNMTPQLGSLNTQAWEILEEKVRDWSRNFDTLYVVTGADIKGSTRTAADNDGKAITVPVGYFKALLGYEKNASSAKFPSQVGGYIAIGFYFEHRSYDSSTYMRQSMTIDELEAKTGFNFFVNLPDDIESRIESTKSTWWK